MDREITPLEYETMQMENQAAYYKGMWAVILGLHPFLDGDQWCILWGDNIQEYVCAFGKTPYEAMVNFNAEMYKKVDGQPYSVEG